MIPGLLFVHAHPDDETITTGATMARYAALGVPITLLTCTRGEQGEVIPADLAHLAAIERGDDGDALAARREQELAEAMRALGVADHRFLHGPTGARYRDSGMAVDGQGLVMLPDQVSPDAFALADLDEAAGAVASVICELRPAAVVSYDPGGGYGHPDHVQAHRVTMRAVQLAAREWRVPRLFWIVVPESVFARRLAQLARERAAGDNPFAAVPDGPAPSMVVPDDAVDVTVDASAFETAKAAALRAHATQVEVAGPYFCLSNRIGHAISGVEYFHLARSQSARAEPAAPGELL